ncbi:MAG: hypothetical protein JWP01_450 [Myxococcales bacterium]|nr:hypothetical protein [Myxococcales bacterium]
MKRTPLILAGCAAAALIALLAMPWVSSDLGSITILDIIMAKRRGYQVGLVILAPLVLAIAVGMGSLKKSHRWMTGGLAVLLLIPAGLSIAAKHGAIGAHISALASAAAVVCAIVLTIKPNRMSLQVAS